MLSLKDLMEYEQITIQCHDNPDADALASGYALYVYFHSKGKKARFIYSGVNQIQKANLRLMIDKLGIPVEYVEPGSEKIKGLLITVDAQYGAGNITRFEADEVAIIDHHQIEIEDVALCRVEPSFGSCATLVWLMLYEVGYNVETINLGTALYYGLYTDTNQLSELFNPNDKDMRDEIPYDPDLIRVFVQCNLSLQELEIAGLAMLRSIYNAEYHYAVIKAKPCDPNILGLINDFLIQVAEVESSLVYNETDDGYKLSVRSCSKEVHADELAAYLTEGIGSGGGHLDKAGGYVSKKLYEQRCPTLNTQTYFSTRLTHYFDNNFMIHAKTYSIDVSGMSLYEKKDAIRGYVNPLEIFTLGSNVTLRSAKGDINAIIDGSFYIMVDTCGHVSLMNKKRFEAGKQAVRGKYTPQKLPEYTPILKNNQTGQTEEILDYAIKCCDKVQSRIYAQKLTKTVKVFTIWDDERYEIGKPGDYLCVKEDNLQDIYVISAEIFKATYRKVREKAK